MSEPTLNEEGTVPPKGKWFSTDPEIASVDPESGVVTVHRIGEVRIFFVPDDPTDDDFTTTEWVY